MKLFIPREALFDNPIPPRVFLCTTGKQRIQELPATNRQLNGKWAQYSEFSFDMQRTYVDIITGETKLHPAYDKLEVPRNIFLEGYGYWCLQDIDDTSNDNDMKSVSAFSLEYATSNKYLTNWHINTGEIDSKEVLYNESLYGVDYNTDADSFYKLASGEFDPYESYYIKTPTEDSYVWEQVQIVDANKYAEYINKSSESEYDKLYVKNFPNVQFYNINRPELSLLHLIFEHILEWKIGNVDQSLWRKERRFSEARISVYDFLMNNVAETFGCSVIWDSLSGLVHFYESVEDDEEENEASTRWNTDIYISKENLAQETKVSYSSDNIKTKLLVTGSDNLDIREVNLGRNEIMNLSFYHTLDWMEQDLFDAYDKYLKTLKEAETGLDASGNPSTKYPMAYPDAMKNWVAANNRVNDLMNEVPAEGNVVLIGDEFKKLYCVYTPIYEDGATQEAINSAVNNTVVALTKKLNLYQVDEDISGNKADNILLRLKNLDGDTATIRVYDPKVRVGSDELYNHDASYYIGKTSASGITTYTEKRFANSAEFANQDKSVLYTNNYTVQTTIVRASSGLTDNPSTYTLSAWVRGDLTTDNDSSTGMNNLKGFKVAYIGTMGAYFVLAKDEKQKENLEDYGVNLLKEKHQVYTTIFQTQTEAMFSQEGYQCTASDTAPTGAIADGARWLDTDSNPVALKAYDGNTKTWRTISASLSPEDQKRYEDYQRYIDNYEKLQAVQEVLSEKEREAEYCKNGYVVPDRTIKINSPTLQSDMKNAAEAHLREFYSNANVVNIQFNEKLPLYIFKTYVDAAHTFAVYLNGTQPYVSYSDSQGVYQMIMEYIRSETEMNKFFTVDQWIRLSPFIKEDEFNDSNFLLTGYESEEERIKICQELMDAAAKELNTLCKPSLEFSMTMANILALPEFEPLFNQFQLGNFIRVQIRDGYVKRSRLLEVNINFDDLSDFSCTFGNLVTTKSEIDKHADLLSRAVTAGKQVATSAGSWQRAVDKSNALESEMASGFQNSVIEVGKASGQSISWSENGIMCRKLRDGSIDQYEDAQIAIINNKIVFTNDGWKTSKAVLGEFTVDINNDGTEDKVYGLLADAVVSGIIKGSAIEGGSLDINGAWGHFKVTEDGQVIITGPDNKPLYADTATVDEISQSKQYTTQLVYSNSTIFATPSDSCTITCKVFSWNDDITAQVKSAGAKFSWVRSSNDSASDTEWNNAHTNQTSNEITITSIDVNKNAQFYCIVDFDDDKLTLE